MTDKTIHDLRIGDFIADMHYGEAQLRERFTVVSHVWWDEPGRLSNVKASALDEYGRARLPFADYLDQFLPGPAGYTNKDLRVIGYTHDSTLGNPTVIAGYCYDDRRSGLITLREKIDG